MPAPIKSSEFFKLAGIQDVAQFYRDRFFTGGVLDGRYFDPISRFDIKYARTMWVYDNVHHGASLLDLGCGEGMLALLKRKGVALAGVDLSPEFLQVARHNGYDTTCVAQLTSLPFADASFDYVVSLDLLGHIAFEDKDAVIAEIKRVLRPDGITMHGIEVLDRSLHQDYDSMSEEELLRFISVDGHIGLEDEEENATRFKSFFAHVEAEPRYVLNLSCDEFIKQHDQYGRPFDTDFIDYLRNLSFNEQRAFDMAMGYVFGKISDLHVKLPNNGLYLLLKASNTVSEPLYNAHRNRRDLFISNVDKDERGPICIDRYSRATFDNGWYPANDLPPIARWMGKRAGIKLDRCAVSKIRLDLTTHIPDLAANPLGLEFIVNGISLCSISLFKYGWLELEMDVPKTIAQKNEKLNLEIRADRTWQPAQYDNASADNRDLSIAVCNIEFSY